MKLKHAYWADVQPEQLILKGCGDGNARPVEIKAAEAERLAAMRTFENELNAQGIKYIAGVDEVGRGPIAGPVVTAAVILPANCELPYLNDSKKVTEKRRLMLEPLIKEHAIAWAIGVVGAHKIDEMNILEAAKLAMKQAVNKLPVRPEHLLIDAVTLKDLDLPQTAIIKGDAKSVSIAAASILAKCYRDRLMEVYDRKYPGYGWAGHAGYPTVSHKQAVFELGYSPIHRRSFQLKPIKNKD